MQALAMAATGRNANAAILLEAIWFWWGKKGGRTVNGRRWLYGNYDHWQELTGLSYDQIKRAFILLRRLELVVTENFEAKFFTLLHVRPSEKSSQIRTCGKCEPALGGSAEAPPPQGQISPCNTAIHTSETTAEQTKHPAVGGLPYSTKKDFLCGVKGTYENMKHTGSMKDVEGSVKAQNILHKPDKIGGLVKIWCEHMSEIEGHMIVILPKHRGQLTNFMKACPPLRAETALKTILDNWKAVCAAIQDVAGVETNPYKPSLDYLLKHRDIAISYALSNKPSGPVPQQEVAPEPALQLTATDDTDEKAAQAAILGLKWEKK
jgi:hypothetical protein